MPRKRHTPEEIVAKLRQVDVLVSQGQTVADAVRAIGVTEVTYYRWRQEYGGLETEQVRRPKELETENARLRRAVPDLTLDKLILTSSASVFSPFTAARVTLALKARVWFRRGRLVVSPVLRPVRPPSGRNPTQRHCLDSPSHLSHYPLDASSTTGKSYRDSYRFE